MTAVTAAAATVTLVFVHSFVRFSPFSISARWIFAVCYCYHLVHSNRLLGFIFPLRIRFWNWFDECVSAWCVTVSIGLDFFSLLSFPLFTCDSPYQIYFTHAKQKKQQLIFDSLTLFHFTSYTQQNWNSKYEKLVFNYSFSWFFCRPIAFHSQLVDGVNGKLFHSTQYSKTVSVMAKKGRIKTCWNSFNSHTNWFLLGALEIKSMLTTAEL